LLYSSREESEFFTKSELEYIGHEFNFDALAELTSQKFADEVKDKIFCRDVKSFSYEEGEEHFLLDFYAEDINEKDFVILHTYHDKKDFFTIERISNQTFKKLGLDVSIKVR